MRRHVTLFLLFYVVNVFAQNTVSFKPYFETNKSYFLSVENDCGSLYKNKKAKTNHDVHTLKNIEFKFRQILNQEIHYSWKILDQKYIDSKNERIDFLKGVEIIFKTTPEGRYVGISNLTNLHKQIRDNVNKYVTKDALRKSKDRFSSKNHYRSVKEDPSGLINFLELEIIHYFSFYGVQIQLGSEEFKADRINFPIRGAYVPVDEICNLVKSDKNYTLEVASKFDKDAVTDKHWGSLINAPESLETKFKDNFDLQLKEKYIFNGATGNVGYLEIDCKSKSWLGKNYTFFNKFTYKLSE